MSFTSTELANIMKAAMDCHLEKVRVSSQTLQNMPLLRKLRDKQKTFPVGGDIELTAVGDCTTNNPTNLKKISYKWKELHVGIKITDTELKMDGVSIIDGKPNSHEGEEKTALENLLETKLDDMDEGFGEFNEVLWRDGTQDSKAVPGIQSFINDYPTANIVVAGINQRTNPWWQNRASLKINASTPSNQNLVNTLQSEFPQLRRNGGSPDIFLAGSDFYKAWEKEISEKGNSFRGPAIEYDPTLDNLRKGKYAYVLDSKTILLMVMKGEDMKSHNPKRPAEKYVTYCGVTWTGALVCNQRNANGVYSIA